MGTIANNAPDLNFGVVELPSHNGVQSTFGSYWTHGITQKGASDPARLDAAVKFLQFVTSDEAGSIWVDMVGELPARLNAGSDPELLADPKENAEHVMLLDLARNDLGRVAEGGSVHVNPYRRIERYSHVMHIVSGVRGTLKPEHDALDLFAATFPAGTLVGAPKVRAMELIAELEPVARGLYGGSVGYLSRNGNMDQAITIRTLVFHDGEYSFKAGAGIVADSDPAFEYREVMAKSAILRRAMDIAEEGL